jgi:MurNAc alpha-1-phosphate uridylyltransferase
MHAMILAAGRGERLRPLTDSTPKALATVKGKTLIDWQIERLVKAGYPDLVINHAWLGAQIESHLGNGSRHGARIQYSRESQALETLGGIVAALPALGSQPFLVVSADIHTDFDYARLAPVVEALDKPRALHWAHFVLVENPAWHPQGDMGLAATGEVTLAEPHLTYANIAVFHPRAFAGVPRGQRVKLFPWAYEHVRQGRVTGELFQGAWHNIGTAQDLAVANRTPAAPADREGRA